MDFIVLVDDEKQVIELCDKKDSELLITFKKSFSQTHPSMLKRYNWTRNATVQFRLYEGKETLRQLFDNMRERNECLRR